jgi:hypothetical protein
MESHLDWPLAPDKGWGPLKFQATRDEVVRWTCGSAGSMHAAADRARKRPESPANLKVGGPDPFGDQFGPPVRL